MPRLLMLDSVYRDCLAEVYTPALAAQPYAEQLAALRAAGFGWGWPWIKALAPHGYELSVLLANVPFCQRAWAREQGLVDAASLSLAEIARQQVAHLRPEIVWMNCFDPELFSQTGIRALRAQCPSIKRVIAEGASFV